MKTPLVPNPFSAPRPVLSALAVASFCSVAVNHAMAESMFKLGLGNEFDSGLSTGGQVFLNIVRLVMFIIVIVGFVKFMRSKNWVDLLYVAAGIVGFGFSQKIVEALFKFGGGPTA